MEGRATFVSPAGAGSSPAARGGRAARAGFAVFLAALVLAMVPYTPEPTTHIKELLIRLAGFGLPLLAIAGTRRAPQSRGPATPLLAGFLLANALAWAVNPFRGHGSEWLSMLVAYAGVYTAASHVYRTPEQVRPTLLAALAAVTASFGYAVSQRAGLDPMPWSAEHRLSDVYANFPGTFGNPNLAAHTLVLCIVATVFVALRPRWRWALVFFVPLLAHLYFTTQRAGWLALAAAAGVTVFAGLARRRGLRPKAGVSFTLGAAVAAGAVCAVLGFTAFRAATGAWLPVDRSLLIRGASYTEAGQMAAERPLRGYGPGAYTIHNPKFWSPFSASWYANKRYTKEYVHNEVLEAAVDAGLAGGLLYGMALLAGIVAGLYTAFAAAEPDRRRFGLMAGAALTAFLVDGMFGFNLRAPVSGAFAVTLLGMTAGLFRDGRLPGAAPPGAWRRIATAGALALLAVNAVYGVRGFVAAWHLQEGRSAMHWGQHDRAAAALARAERLAPWDKHAPRTAGHNDRDRGPSGFEAATAALERAHRNAPWDIATLTALQRAYLDLALRERNAGNPDWGRPLARALAFAQQTDSVCPVLPETRTTVGTAKTLTGRRDMLEDARDDLQRAIVYGSRTPLRPLTLLATLSTALGDPDTARRALEQALQVDPGNPDILENLFREATGPASKRALAALLRRELFQANHDSSLPAEARVRLLNAMGRAVQATESPPRADRVWQARARDAAD